MKKIHYLLALVIILNNCSKARKTVDNTIIDNHKKSESLSSIEERLIDTTIFKSFSVIHLETNNESLFRSIDRISIKNELIYVYDNSLKKVIIFDQKGKYINHIHKIGQGPGEYISTIDFCVDEKSTELFLLCDRPYKIMRFSNDGQFISEKRYSGLHKAITIDSGCFFCELFWCDNHEIGRFDNEFNLINTGLLKSKYYFNTCYCDGQQLVKSKNIYYTRRFDSSIYQLTKNSLERKYEFDFGKFGLPEYLSSEEDCYKLHTTSYEQNYIYFITNVVESERFIFFNTNLGICLYDKSTNRIKAFRILFNSSIKYGSNLFYPNEGNGNSIITAIQPSKLLYYDEEMIRNNADVKNLVNNYKEDDNPILIVYFFKE